MRHNNEMSVGEAIEAFLRERGLSEQAAAQKLIANWSRVMGTAIAENTTDIWFKNGIFFVRLSSPAWKAELSMAKSKIRDILNREAGKSIIEEVRIL